MKQPPVIRTVNLVKSFPVGQQAESVLRGISLEIRPGFYTIIFGPSGSGKSTLLNVLVGLELPSSGEVYVGQERLDQLDEDARATLRSRTFGIVYQQSNWIKALSVVENVALPALIVKTSEKAALAKAKELLGEVGMMKFARYHPLELSGGQQQRVSLARALVNNPQVLVLDEPTGNLDTHSADEIMMLIQELNVKYHRTIIMVTHNLIYLPYATHQIALTDGQVAVQKAGVKAQIRRELKGVKP